MSAVTTAGRKSDAQAQAVAVGKANMVDVVTAVAESETAVQAHRLRARPCDRGLRRHPQDADLKRPFPRSGEAEGEMQMTGPEVMDVARDAIVTLILVTAPLMLVGLIVGVAVSLVQALDANSGSHPRLRAENPGDLRHAPCRAAVHGRHACMRILCASPRASAATGRARGRERAVAPCGLIFPSCQRSGPASSSCIRARRNNDDASSSSSASELLGAPPADHRADPRRHAAAAASRRLPHRRQSASDQFMVVPLSSRK